jgi:murein DD-endopeptidase MepM/ murein hydrolase activator NlpD
MGPVYSIVEFRQIANSLQMTLCELSDYPVIFPVKGPLRISSGFGMRYHPVYKMRKFHKGIDISKTEGTPVYAAGNGVVVHKGYGSGYGNFIEIRHAGGFRSFYAHLGKMMVNIGDSVSMAAQIACVGNTGLSTNYHLHYEIRKGKRFLDPAGWCGLLYEKLNMQILTAFYKTGV